MSTKLSSNVQEWVVDQTTLPRKKRTPKPKKTDAELVSIFWASSDEAFFGQETIAPVVNKSIKTLEADRWRGNGIPFRKCSGRILYQKIDVVAWIKGHDLVHSTCEKGAHHG